MRPANLCRIFRSAAIIVDVAVRKAARDAARRAEKEDGLRWLRMFVFPVCSEGYGRDTSGQERLAEEKAAEELRRREASKAAKAARAEATTSANLTHDVAICGMYDMYECTSQCHLAIIKALTRRKRGKLLNSRNKPRPPLRFSDLGFFVADIPGHCFRAPLLHGRG